MAFLGNADASGSGNGPLRYTLAADITGMAAGTMATIKIGTLATGDDTGAVYALRTTGGVRSWVLIS